MKPWIADLAVVTASTNLDRAADCLRSWRERADYDWPLIIVVNGAARIDEGTRFSAFDHQATYLQPASGHLGTVPAFASGMEYALAGPATVIACLHDDLLLEEDGWDAQVLDLFNRDPAVGLAGFGGATGLGSPDLYHQPYDPMQLARQDFVSNLREAEAHGRRSDKPEPVAVLDGFSQIGRREFWEGLRPGTPYAGWNGVNLFSLMASAGVVHHAYDAALGCYAKRLGWKAWMLPIACHHFGGRTAVGDPAYHAWAQQQTEGGDQGFWKAAHEWCYREFTDVLPIRV